MEWAISPSKSTVSLLSEYHIFKEKFWLHHRRLEHLSFRTFKILFPFLFGKLNVESSHCEVCELVKHKRSTFLVSNKKSSKPFHLIHSDI